MATTLFVRRLSSVLAVLLLAQSSFVWAPVVHAQEDPSVASSGERPETAGDLDPTFGNGGIKITDFFGGYDAANSLALQADAKIVLAGAAFHGSDLDSSDFALARYNPDGSLDPSFGAAGKQTTDFFGHRDEANAVAGEPDGKIVAIGFAQHSNSFSSGDFALARYNQDGSLDQSFALGGKQTTDFFGATDYPTSVVIQQNGRIVVAGYAAHGSGGSTFALARYNQDGSLDQSFGSGGKLTTDFFGSINIANGIAIQSDGKLVVAGYAFRNSAVSSLVFALARYNPDGSLDQTFGAGGKQTTAFFGNGDAAASVAIQPDGKILVAGSAFQDSASSIAVFALARYNPDGTLDQTFGAGGKQTTGFFGSGDHLSGVALQANGKIVAAGAAAHSPSTNDLALARYNPDGTLDQTFGASGLRTTNLRGNGDDNDGAAGVVIQPDGKIVVAGTTGRGGAISTLDFAVARYTAVAADFAISFDPSSVTAPAGTKAPVTVLISRTGGFNGNVTVTPPGPSMGIKPKPADPIATTAPSVVFKMKVGAGVPPGSYTRTFSAVDDSGRTRTATVTIVVQ